MVTDKKVLFQAPSGPPALPETVEGAIDSTGG